MKHIIIVGNKGIENFEAKIREQHDRLVCSQPS